MPETIASFGDVDGRQAKLFTLHSDELRLRITDYGGILVSVETRDRHGRFDHVLLGFEDAATYASVHGSFGAILGRSANRIAEGRFKLDGKTFSLAKNEKHATLHGGPVGFGKRFWSLVDLQASALTLNLTSPDGDQGFPGDVRANVTYRLSDSALELSFDATTMGPTPVSLSAHPYFNLDGAHEPSCLDHFVEIAADSFLPTDANQIPLGELASVAGTPFDFRRRHAIGDRIREPDPQLRIGRGYDHYFVLEDRPGLKTAARVWGPKSGRCLEILTTQPGLQFYSGNNLDGSAPGRGGLYRQSAGFAFEPHGFPNAPNEPNFPSTILRPGETYHEEIVYRFSAEGRPS